jgi:hypothetical protein
MLRMVSYSHRLQSGHIVCYLDRTYHGLTTSGGPQLLKLFDSVPTRTVMKINLAYTAFCWGASVTE